MRAKEVKTVDACEHEWAEYTGRGHTYVNCARCHRFPVRHLVALQAMREVADELQGMVNDLLNNPNRKLPMTRAERIKSLEAVRDMLEKWL